FPAFPAPQSVRLVLLPGRKSPFPADALLAVVDCVYSSGPVVLPLPCAFSLSIARWLEAENQTSLIPNASLPLVPRVRKPRTFYRDSAGNRHNKESAGPRSRGARDWRARG